MANTCKFTMNVKGEKAAINDFYEMLKNNCVGNGARELNLYFSSIPAYNSGLLHGKITGECDWNIDAAFNDVLPRESDKKYTLREAFDRSGLALLDIDSEIVGLEVEEHFTFTSKTCVKSISDVDNREREDER